MQVVAEAGTVDFFMVGDVRGSWKSAPAKLFTRIFLDATSPEVFRHACMSQLMFNDEIYIFLIVAREAKHGRKHIGYLYIRPDLLDVRYKEIVGDLRWKIGIITEIYRRV